jgi:hypothetical protein
MDGNRQDYESLAPLFKAIPAADVREPDTPVNAYCQYAEMLYQRYVSDKAVLTGAGLDEGLAEQMLPAIGALMYAEGRWRNERFDRTEDRQAWVDAWPEGQDTVSVLLHAYRYVFADDPVAMRKLREVARGSRQDDTILDLETLAQMGVANREQLQAVGLDMSLVDSASRVCRTMSRLRATAHTSEATTEAQDMRDRAFTFLDRVASKVRRCGQYVFWRSPEKLAGYTDEYRRELRARAAAESKVEAESTAAAG